MVRNTMTSSVCDAAPCKRDESAHNRLDSFALATIRRVFGALSTPILGISALTSVYTRPAFASDKLELIPDYALFGLILDKPGFGSLWIMLIGFVVLIFPLNKLIFQPIFRVLDERAARIQGARKRSTQLQQNADTVLEQYETAIRGARAQSEATRQGQLATAREEQALLTTQARGEADNELARARSSLKVSLEEARTTLRADAESLATAAAEQVLGRAL